MDKINLVLTSSQQMHNACAIGDTEQDHTQLIAQDIYAKIKNDIRLNVICLPILNKGSDKANLIECVRLSNEFINKNGGTGYHLSIHTDGGYNGAGASGFYSSEAGKCFGRFIYDEMCLLTPWKDMRFTERPGLYELGHTKAVAFLLEVAFHDKPDQAKWIHNNIDSIADAIVLGIYKGIGIEPYQPEGDLETAVKYLSKTVGIDPEIWLGNAKSRKVMFLDLFIIKMAKYISKLKGELL